MKCERMAALTAMGLAALLAMQVMYRFAEKPSLIAKAVWRNHPTNLSEANALAEFVAVGKVTDVRRADDLVIHSPERVSKSMRVPIEVISFEVEKAYKGKPTKEIKVFHTGLSIGIPINHRPVPNVAATRKLPPLDDEEARNVILEDDPAYKPGEKHLLFLTSGPNVTLDGEAIDTWIVVSPEGRYRVSSNGILEPAASSGFASELRGRSFGQQVEPLLLSKQWD